jgi:2-oxoisovalerate dehydrogenase E1 component alpha subunit
LRVTSLVESEAFESVFEFALSKRRIFSVARISKVESRLASRKPMAAKSVKQKPSTSRRSLSPSQSSLASSSKSKTVTSKLTIHTKKKLPKELMLQMLDLMIKSRVLEERLIKVQKTGDAFFWIGGPGEEAFGVPLGLLTKKGQGPEYDYMHLHYRCTPTLVAMGLEMIDSLRLIMNRATDVSTGGRNFSSHYCFPKWNVLPVTSPIEVQYGVAVGTAIAQRKRSTDGISIVTGGDAGTAEGDFASSLIWSSRPGAELPIYLTVQNNLWGISTNYASQHGEERIADRGKAFGIRTRVVDGNDPVESYLAIQDDMSYIRKNRKPALTEFMVSRLYGHSSGTGANRESNQACCIERFEKAVVDAGLIKPAQIKEIWIAYDDESRKVADIVRGEPAPTKESVWDHVYADGENSDWRKF